MKKNVFNISKLIDNIILNNNETDALNKIVFLTKDLEDIELKELFDMNISLNSLLNNIINSNYLNTINNCDNNEIVDLINCYCNYKNIDISKIMDNFNFDEDFSDHLINHYFTSLSDLLTSEEEKIIVNRVKNGDKNARDILIKRNIRLVVSIAKNYLYDGIRLEDLISEGMIGLIKAVDKFDASKGCKFSTHAYWWIRQSIARYIDNNLRTIKLPLYIQILINKYKKLEKKYEDVNHKKPSDKELAKLMNISSYEIRMLKSYTKDTISLSLPIGENDQETLYDIISDESVAPTEEIVENKIMLKICKEYVDSIPNERNRKIMNMRLGFENNRIYTLDEVGEMFGISRERVRQIEEKYKRFIRPKLKEFKNK